MADRPKTAAKPVAKTPRRRPARTDADPAPAAVNAQPAEEAEEPRYVGELKVVKDEPLLSPLGKVNGKQVTFHSYRVWTLEDKTQVHVCARCYDFTGTRGEVRRHLVAEHGMNSGGARKQEPATNAVTGFMSMSLAEVVELVQSAGQWGEMLDTAETQVAEWKDRALTAELENRRFRSMLDKLGFAPKETD